MADLPNNTDQLVWDSAALAFATQFRLPLTNEYGGYGEVTIERGAGDYRDLWAVTDGSLTRLRVWVDPDGWQYITEIGWAGAYRHTLREAFTLGRQVVEIESACLDAQISALHP